MALSSAQILDFLENHSIRKHNGDFNSLLEMLHYIYTASDPVSNDTLHAHFQKVEKILQQLSSEQADTLFSAIRKLCTEYERGAFSHGIAVGMLLMTELNALP